MGRNEQRRRHTAGYFIRNFLLACYEYTGSLYGLFSVCYVLRRRSDVTEGGLTELLA